MCTIDKEIVTVGFLNTWNNRVFEIGDIYSFIGTLWNAGCGIIQLDFTGKELESFLDKCSPIVKRYGSSWEFCSEELSTDEESVKLFHSKSRAKSFDLFCRLRASLNTEPLLLAAMGYDFILGDRDVHL